MAEPILEERIDTDLNDCELKREIRNNLGRANVDEYLDISKKVQDCLGYKGLQYFIGIGNKIGKSDKGKSREFLMKFGSNVEELLTFVGRDKELLVDALEKYNQMAVYTESLGISFWTDGLYSMIDEAKDKYGPVY